MKLINYFNYFLVGLPALGFIIVYPISQEPAKAILLVSSIIIGILHIIIATAMIISEPRDLHLKIYFSLVILFVCLSLIYFNIGYENILDYFLIIMPPVLAIYLSVIIYKKAQNENTNKPNTSL